MSASDLPEPPSDLPEPPSSRHGALGSASRASSAGPHDRMDAVVRLGVALLALGTVAAVITLIPLFTGAEPFGLWIYLLSLLAPLGLAVLFVALWRRGRSRSSRIAQASERS